MAILDKIKKTVKNQDESASVKKEEKKGVKKSEKLAKSSDVVYYGILREPYITEKTAMMGQENKYAFKVRRDANKIDIKNAVENIFGVTVVSVSVINTPSKNVRLGRYEGRKPGFKKAIVKLKEGDKIDIGV